MGSGIGDRAFTDSIAEMYDRLLTPLIFEAYAKDLVRIVASQPVTRVLEVAAGTGVVTRELLAMLGEETRIDATDINQSMIDRARLTLEHPRIRWSVADALGLPFEDDQFDCVVCQFSAMFFPDRPGAYAEARRVLRPGGRYVMNVWDHIGVNAFAHAVEESLAGIFPNDPPRFMSRTPHGYSGVQQILDDLHAGGFDARATIDTRSMESRGACAEGVAMAFCCGTPLRHEIEQRDPGGLKRAIGIVRAALADQFGERDLMGIMQAHVVAAIA